MVCGPSLRKKEKIVCGPSLCKKPNKPTITDWFMYHQLPTQNTTSISDAYTPTVQVRDKDKRQSEVTDSNGWKQSKHWTGYKQPQPSNVEKDNQNPEKSQLHH
jgi:hypothetical protein